MLYNQSVAWRPAVISPLGGAPRPRVMAQAVNPAITKPVKAVALTIGIAMAGATAWVGYDVAMRRHGLLKVLGYVVGIGGALSLALDLVSLGLLGYQAASGTPAPAATTSLPLM